MEGKSAITIRDGEQKWRQDGFEWSVPPTKKRNHSTTTNHHKSNSATTIYYIDMELQEPTLNLETVTINSSNPNQNPNSNPCGAIQLEISNDDFIDVPENLSPLPPPAPVISTQFIKSSTVSTMNSTTDSNFEASDWPDQWHFTGE
ncbi:unnamed protein product [Ilex paraguariensis]|uniref:Uncharacterized protein n=1 Tax=Ilex paraguariensis TaxID=185542 RepID=A0ABC8UR52_9AQUA